MSSRWICYKEHCNQLCRQGNRLSVVFLQLDDRIFKPITRVWPENSIFRRTPLLNPFNTFHGGRKPARKHPVLCCHAQTSLPPNQMRLPKPKRQPQEFRIQESGVSIIKELHIQVGEEKLPAGLFASGSNQAIAWLFCRPRCLTVHKAA